MSDCEKYHDEFWPCPECGAVKRYKKYETDHWSNAIFPNSFNWRKAEKDQKSYLAKIGEVGVDSASVTVEIDIRDAHVDGPGVHVRLPIFTPDGDGWYRVLAGKLEGLGRVLVVCFDEPEEGKG